MKQKNLFHLIFLSPERGEIFSVVFPLSGCMSPLATRGSLVLLSPIYCNANSIMNQYVINL